MTRIVRWSLFALLACAGLTACASATTYYIAANGSDSSNGTSKTSSWQHAPGMPSCSGTCASTTPQPGDSFIFRGGDTWHFGSNSGTPYTGGTWAWTKGGSSSNCNLNASASGVVKTSCVYIGVDQSWFSGSSWARPILTMDNPLSTGQPGSCAHDDSGYNGVEINASYVIFDNFDIQGNCLGGNPTAGWTGTNGNQVEFSNNYYHGWTLSASAVADSYPEIGYGGGSGFVLVDHNVFDGSDSTFGASIGQASGKALGVGTEVAYNVFWRLTNGMIAGTSMLTSVHDNQFYYLIEPIVGGVHGNIIEWLGSGPAGSTYFYNNLMYTSGEGEGVDMYTGTSGTAYIFNNISWQYRAVFGSLITNGAFGSNCYMGEVSGTFNFFNNTSDSPCSFEQPRGTISLIFENNHFIGFSSPALSAFASNGSANTDNGGEVFQSESAANGQGYTTANNYAPTASSGATVGAGKNLTSFCGGIGDSAAAAACTRGYAGVTYNRANHTAVLNAPTSRPSSGAWDTGAYQFSSAGSGRPNAPTGLSATVQ
jgi:hypothetical protein